MRKDLVHLFYQHHVVIQQEHFILSSIEPSADFLEDMEILLGSDETHIGQDLELEFPPEGTKEDFHFDPKQIQGLQIDSPQAQLLHEDSTRPVANCSVSYLNGENCDVQSLQSWYHCCISSPRILILHVYHFALHTTGDGNWASVLLEPAVAMGPASFVEFVILEQPANIRNNNMLFGISVRIALLFLLPPCSTCKGFVLVTLLQQKIWLEFGRVDVCQCKGYADDA